MVLPKGNRRSLSPYRTLSLSMIGLVVALLAGPAGALGASTATSHPAAPTAVPASPAQLFQSAVASLATGAGPAFGSATSCTEHSATSASCYSPTLAAHAHPSVVPPVIWQNASPGSNLYGAPSAGLYAAMAWDPQESSILYFGGCDLSACPDNQTWLYYFGEWYNETNYSNAPPAATGIAIAFDNYFDVILLYGGCSIVCPDNYTFSYYNGVWSNDTGFSFTNPAPRDDASMVFVNDSSDNWTMLFGGDDNGVLLNDTWEFQGLAGWVEIFPSTAPSPRAVFAMAYYPGGTQAVLFGGCTFFSCDLNDTWVFSGGQWSNYTSSFPLLGYANPPGRGYAAMTYDGALNAIILVGGVNSSGPVNDTWEYTCPFFCGWTDVTNASSAIPEFYAGSMASDSSVNAPILVGGEIYNGTGYHVSNSTWVYEPQFTIAPTILPSTGPARALITATLNAAGGNYPLYTSWSALGSSLYGDNLTFYFTYPGTYQLNITSYDFYGVLQTATLLATETGVSALAQVSASSADVGVSLNFSTVAATGGSPAYTYNWSWGDGSANGTGLTASHAYAAAGVYTATLEVIDSLGLTNTTSVTVTVSAAPSVSFTPATANAGAAVTFTATVTGGTGPYTYSWNFGDHSTASTAASPSHTYASAGSYVVWLNVTDADGMVAASHSTVAVTAAALAVTATANPVTGVTGELLNFTAVASGGQNPYTYSWVFGDGGTSTSATTTHAYTTAGAHTATVWVNDSSGGSVHGTVTVTITAAGGGNNNNGGGTSSSSSPLSGSTLWILIALIVIVVVVAVAVMMMRGRKGGGSSAPPSGASGGAEPPAGASGAPPAPPVGGAPPS